MTKSKIALVSLAVLLLPVMALAIAQPTANPTGAAVGDLTAIINSVLRTMWVVFAAIAVICFLVAGILFLTAGGQPEKIQSARNAFIWGIAGVVVGIIAYSIIAIVGSFVTG